LWEMTRAEVLPDAWKSEEVKEALDLCLSCKGCKGDCPVNVDVATYRAEFLSHYWESRVRPLSAYLFGWINKWAALAKIAPWAAKGRVRMPGLSSLIKKAGGIAWQQNLPRLADATFTSRFQNRRNTATNNGKEVMLWPDTFNNHFRPDTLHAATE